MPRFRCNSVFQYQSGYHAGSNYMMPQYTQAQPSAYHHQYGQHSPKLHPQQQHQQPYVVDASPYGQPAGNSYGQIQVTTTTPAYGHGGNLVTLKGATRPRGPRIWKCELTNCSSTANFTRRADLQRHQATVHGLDAPGFPCTVKDCIRVSDRGFTRRDHLVEHLRNFHHIDIPKRKSGGAQSLLAGPAKLTLGPHHSLSAIEKSVYALKSAG